MTLSIGGSPANATTINELREALGVHQTIRYDQSQSLTPEEQLVAQANIGLNLRTSDTGLYIFPQRDDLVIEGTGARGMTVVTPSGRAGLDLTGDDGAGLTSGDIHFWDAANPTRSHKISQNNSQHPQAPNGIYMRNSANYGANNHESQRWFFDPSTSDNNPGNSAFLGSVGVGIATDIWQPNDWRRVLTIADDVGSRLGNTAGMVHVFSSSGELRAVTQGGSAQLTGSNPRFVFNDSGASGVQVHYLHNSTSPAANDITTDIQFRGTTSTAAEIRYAGIRNTILNPDNATADGRLSFGTVVNGTFNNRFHVAQGLFAEGVTGGDKGQGTANFIAVFDENVLLSCYPIEQWLDGKITLEKWDAKVPDRQFAAIPATQVPKMEPVASTGTEIVVEDGVAVERVVERITYEPVYELIPVVGEDGEPIMDLIEPAVFQPAFEKDEGGNVLMQRVDALFVDATDEDGNPVKMQVRPGGECPVQKLDENGEPLMEMVREAIYEPRMVRVPVMEEVPGCEARVEVRRHDPMRKFKARIGTKYDPLTIEGIERHLREKRHLWAMPNEEKFEEGDELSQGSWNQRMLETVEVLAIHIVELNNRLKLAEAKL